MDGSDEYKRFDGDAQRLMEFGTRMISNLDETSVNKIKQGLNRITERSSANTDVSIDLPKSGIGLKTATEGSVDKVDTSIDAEAERIVFTNIQGLRAAVAAEFGVLFSKAQESYRDLRVLLLAKEAGRAVKNK